MPSFPGWCIAPIMLALSAPISTAAMPAGDASHGHRDDPALQRLLADVCDREVVALGEDAGHGSARAIEVRAWLVRRLVQECGFSAVAFESQIYDFMALEEAQASGALARDAVADAIGGLWSTVAESGELIDFLAAEASAGRLRLLGLDPQVGGATQRYTQNRLPGRLAAPLPPDRRAHCGETIARLTGWRYDAVHPYDDAARRELHACADEILAAHDRIGNALDGIEPVLARAFATHLAMAEIQGENFRLAMGLRGRTMADHLRWHRKRLGADARVVIWTATVHAARRSIAPDADARRMGEILHEELGDTYAAIGFTAAAGSHARAGMSPQPIPASLAGSLERRVLDGAASALGYADRDALHALGTAPGHALSYGRVESVDWSEVLDGLVVFAEERPPHPLRAARPSAH